MNKIKKALTNDTALRFVVGFGAVFVFLYDSWLTPHLLHWENFWYHPYLALGELVRFNGPRHIMKIFDVCAIDACVNRFRPLGHFFNMIDAKFIFSFIAPLKIGFMSISHFLFTILCSVFIYLVIRERTDISKGWARTWALFYLSTSGPLLVSSFVFRPTKSIAAFASIYFFYIWICRQKLKIWSNFKIGLCSFFCVLLCFADEQVILISGIFFLYTIKEWISEKDWKPFKFVTLSYLFLGINLFWIGPLTFKAFTSPDIQRDYSLSFSFVEFNPEIFLGILQNIIIQMGGFLGYLTYWQVGLWIFSGALVYFLFLFWRDDGLLVKRSELITILISTILIYYLLGLRHPSIVANDRFGGYYGFPINSILYLLFIDLALKFKRYSHGPIGAVVLILGIIGTYWAVLDLRKGIFPKTDIGASVPNTWMESRLVGDFVMGKHPEGSRFLELSDPAKRYLRLLFSQSGRSRELPLEFNKSE